MANGQLTATVRLNTTQAEKALNRLSTKINQINKAVNSANRGGRTDNTVQKVSKINRFLTQMGQKLNRITSSNQRLNSLWNKASTLTSKVSSGINKWKTSISNAVNSAKRFNSALNSTKGLTSSIWNTLKGLAATYLGIMGTRTAVETSDTITSAQNKLNYLNAQQMGAAGYGSDGAYSSKVLNMTQETMDKMYTSAQKVRMSYTDMMTNVTKTMTLAGDAFDNNIDNAIRFQEIMAESYTLGGASAAEMSSSMYQLTQALGAGVLAGDELRSVREGAPLAYQQIEKFAQGVYNTEESLKELGSQGKITSDMVVAAIMNMGDEADKAFAQTHILFSQAWEMIKNSAKKAFEPVSNMLRDMLNKAMDSGLIDKFEVAFYNIAKALMIGLQAISNAFSWIAENWSWLEGVLVSGLITIGILMVATAIKSIIVWIAVNWQLLLVAAAIFAVIYLLYQWQNASIDTCTLIVALIGIIAVALFFLFGWQVALIVALLGLAFMFFEQVCGGAMWLVTALYNVASYITSFLMACIFSLLAIIQNVIAFIVNLVMGCVNVIVAISHNAVAGIINVAMGLYNSIQAIATNIGIAFQNAWIWAKNAFWEFVADVLSGVAKLEPVINGIAKLIGKDGIDISGAVSTARSKKSSYQSFVSVGNAWNSGMDTISYKNIGDSWSNGWNTMNYANLGDAWSKGWNMSERMSLSDAYSKGANWGANLKDKINDWGSGKADSLKNLLGDKINPDKLGKKLGLDLTNIPGANALGIPGTSGSSGGGSSPKGGFGGSGGSYDPQKVLDNIKNNVGGINDNTGSIADSMELSEEDLSFLRDVANMEWKKEFTTATIQVDMSNYNTVNSELDIFGIMNKLSDALYEEMDYVANGVYE